VAAGRGRSICARRWPTARSCSALTPSVPPQSPNTTPSPAPRYQSTTSTLAGAFSQLKQLSDPNTCPKGCIPQGAPPAGGAAKCLCVGPTLDRVRVAARDAGGALLPAVVGLALVFVGATYLIGSGAAALAVAGRDLRERRRLQAKAFGGAPGTGPGGMRLPRLMPQVRREASVGCRADGALRPRVPVCLPNAGAMLQGKSRRTP
jgi:hypothetical protein